MCHRNPRTHYIPHLHSGLYTPFGPSQRIEEAFNKRTACCNFMTRLLLWNLDDSRIGQVTPLYK